MGATSCRWVDPCTGQWLVRRVVPGADDVGINSFVVRVEDQSGDYAEAVMNIFVDAAPVPGDVNRDGLVNAVDIQLVINDVLGLDVPFNCDINCSGSVDAIDIQLVINAVLGIDITEAVAGCQL